ncbi:MAG: hypothetical protein ACE5IO_02385 [Thermoplasmata archaeon]
MPPGVVTGMVLAIVGMVMVLIGLSISFYEVPLNAWDAIGQDAQFAYIIVLVIFAILAMVFSIIIYWVRQPAFLQIIRATGILGIILPIILWLHGYAYAASWYDGDFGAAFEAMGFGFGWIIALIGGVFFLIAAQMIKNAIPFAPHAPIPPAQPGYYQQPPQQPTYQPPQDYQQPPQQPPQPPPGTP